MEIEKIRVRLRVNGVAHTLLIEPRRTLLEVLREDLGLTGAKEGCGVGGCGACTVLYNSRPLRSCITLALEVENGEIVTIEGLANLASGKEAGRLHPIQEAFVENHGIQCGFCSPGMILSAKALLEENPSPTAADVREALSGQVCRCTGYVKIVDSVLDAAARMNSAGDGK